MVPPWLQFVLSPPERTRAVDGTALVRANLRAEGWRWLAGALPTELPAPWGGWPDGWVLLCHGSNATAIPRTKRRAGVTPDLWRWN
jgi:hypothetical protein